MKHFFTILLSIILLGTSYACTLEQEAYAVMSPDSTTLTFYFDSRKSFRKGTSYELNTGENIPKWINSTEQEIMGPFTTVIFDDSFKRARPSSCAHWFDGFGILEKIKDIGNLNTSNVTNMSCMFRNCGITSLDVNNFNTANVTNMNSMFKGCNDLTYLGISNFNTAMVTDMEEMFRCCYSLTSLDVSNFNTTNVTNMHSMFYGCGITSLDVNNFNTANVTNMHSMFYGCSRLTSLDISNFNTANVTYMGGMFSKCCALTNLNVSNLNTTNVDYMNLMFWGCTNLTSLDLSSFNTSKNYDMWGMFEGCTNLKTIYVGTGWNTSKVKHSKNVFKDCTSLVGGRGTKFDSNVTGKSRAKIDGGKANPGYFTAKK